MRIQRLIHIHFSAAGLLAAQCRKPRGRGRDQAEAGRACIARQPTGGSTPPAENRHSTTAEKGHSTTRPAPPSWRALRPADETGAPSGDGGGSPADGGELSMGSDRHKARPGGPGLFFFPTSLPVHADGARREPRSNRRAASERSPARRVVFRHLQISARVLGVRRRHRRENKNPIEAKLDI